VSQPVRETVVLLPGGSRTAINPLVYANAGALGDGSFRRYLFALNGARDIVWPPVVLGRFDRDTFVDATGPYHILAGEGLNKEQFGRRQEAVTIDFPCVFACHPGRWVWGHWLIDTLPKILLAERAFPGRFHFVVPPELTDPASQRYFVRCVLESLAAYGIDHARLLRLQPGPLYRFVALFDVADMRQPDGVHPGVLAALRHMDNPPVERGRQAVTAVMRGRNDTRQLINRAEIDAVVRRHGASELDAHAAPFLEQVRAFRDSTVIVGDMGSNLAYAVYARPEAGIVTTAPCGWLDGYFADIFRYARLFHADVRGISAGSTADEIAVAAHSVMPVHLEAGIAAVDAARQIGIEHAPIVDGREMPRALGNVLFRLDFKSGGNAGGYDRQGFFVPEYNGTWSDGPRSRVVVEGFVPPGGDVWLEIKGTAFTRPPTLEWRMLGVSVNGTKLGSFDAAGESRLQVRLPASGQASTLTIEFDHGACPSPKSFGDSADNRRLGFMFTTMVLREAARKDGVLF
jgi:hypothetical protein